MPSASQGLVWPGPDLGRLLSDPAGAARDHRGAPGWTRLAGLGLATAAGWAAFAFVASLPRGWEVALALGARAPAVVALGVALSFPALAIYGTVLGARLGIRDTLHAVLSGGAAGGAVLFARVPLSWFYAGEYSEVGAVANAVIVVGAVVTSGDTFLRAARALDPGRSRLLDLAWLGVVVVLTAELARLGAGS